MTHLTGYLGVTSCGLWELPVGPERDHLWPPGRGFGWTKGVARGSGEGQQEEGTGA